MFFVFLSYLIKDFCYYLYLKGVYRLGFFSMLGLFWKVIAEFFQSKVNKTGIRNIYRFIAFVTLLERSESLDLNSYINRMREKVGSFFLPSMYLDNDILRFVTIKVPFKLKYKKKKYRYSGVRFVLERLIKRYFYVKKKFTLIFSNFKQKYISLVVQHKALSHLMLDLANSKDYVLWSMLTEILYIYKNKVDKIISLFKLQKLRLTKLQEKRKKQHRILVLNYIDRNKMSLGALYNKITSLKKNLAHNVERLRNRFYVRKYDDFMKNFCRLKLRPKKVESIKYRCDDQHMRVFLKRLIFGVSMDLIFLNFIKFKKTKFIKMPVVDQLKPDWVLSNFIFMGEYRAL